MSLVTIIIEEFETMEDNLFAAYEAETGDTGDGIYTWFSELVKNKYSGMFVKLFENEDDDWRMGVVFPSEEDRMMFVLEWT